MEGPDDHAQDFFLLQAEQNRNFHFEILDVDREIDQSLFVTSL